MNFKRMIKRILTFPLMLIMGTFGDTGSGTITTSHTFNKTYYQGKFLEGQENYVVWDQFASREKNANIPKNAGETVVFTRVAPFALSRTALTQGTNPSATDINGNTVSATVLEYGAYVKPSKKFWLTSMDKDLAETAVEQGKAAASTIDSLIWEKIAEGGIGLRADADANESGERSITGSSSTTTRIIWSVAMSGLASGDTGVVVFLTGKNAGLSREFTCDATNPTTETVVAALDQAPASGDLIRLCGTVGLTTADTVGCGIIRKAVAILESNGAAVFDDGKYHAVYSPLEKYDFQRDSEWINMQHYAAPKDLYRNIDGEYANVRFHKDIVPYRHTAGTIGTYVSSAAVYVISIFGKNAFGNVRVKGVDKKFYMCPPVATADNQLAMYGSMGWYELCCPTVLNGRNIVNIFNVPTTV